MKNLLFYALGIITMVSISLYSPKSVGETYIEISEPGNHLLELTNGEKYDTIMVHIKVNCQPKRYASLVE